MAPSNQRMEFDILNISGGQPFKDFNLYLEVYPRFDIRLDSKAVSLGNIAIWLAMAIPINAIQSSDTSGFLAKYFITGSLWLASGSTHFVLLGNNLTGLSIFENHLYGVGNLYDTWDAGADRVDLRKIDNILVAVCSGDGEQSEIARRLEPVRQAEATPQFLVGVHAIDGKMKELEVRCVPRALALVARTFLISIGLIVIVYGTFLGRRETDSGRSAVFDIDRHRRQCLPSVG